MRHRFWMISQRALIGLLASGVWALGGCQFVGMMAASQERYGSRDVPAAYRGLEGRSYAVVVQASRDILAENPNLMEHLLAGINQRVAAESGASGHVPTEQLALYLMNNPRWVALSNAELAEELGGVDRLIVLDLSDYRLQPPGNAYVWEAVAQGRVFVFESDGAGSGEIAFERDLKVTFPDQEGVSTDDLPRSSVTSVLAKRLVDRVVWLFHDHEEPNAITY